MPKKRLPPPKRIWVLFDNLGEEFGSYKTFEEADEDAYGPRFRPKYTVRAYDLVPLVKLKEEKRSCKPGK